MLKVIVFTVAMFGLVVSTASAQSLSKPQMRDIDRLASHLEEQAKELHLEFHEHLEAVPHAEKLELDAEEIEKTAKQLRQFVATASGDAKSVSEIRSGSNYFLQNAFEISRTIELAGSWANSPDQQRGISHMREAAQDVVRTALQIEAYLPPNAFEVDGQAEQLEEAVKELHAEYHEHLEGYEISPQLDASLEQLEQSVEHLHDLCHDRTWQQIDMDHLLIDIEQIRQRTQMIESLFTRQAQIGVRTRDWHGIEHSRDAITDVLSANYLLKFMVDKTRGVRSVRNPNSQSNLQGGERPQQRRRPKRDR